MKNINKKTWGIIGTTINLIIIVLYFLIILKILPYNITMGGMLGSYKMAVIVCLSSIFIQLLLTGSILIASGILSFARLYKASIIVLKIFIVYFCINIIMNLFGATWFEKIGASLMAIVQILCMVNIVRRK